MTKDRLLVLLERYGSLRWEGKCHDCGVDVHMTADPCKEGICVNGGAVYEPEHEKFFLKCDACHGKDSVLRDWKQCEVYSRVVGYLRPVRNWNDSKQQEFKDRKVFDSKGGL